MDCGTCREAVSARLDGEAGPPGADAHLAACAACRDWAAAAARLTRELRVREVRPTPDLTAAIMAAHAGATREPAGRRRLALGMVAVAQLTLGLAQLLGVADPHAGPVDPHATAHLLNESSAWTIAIGVALAWAAFRPAVATGVLITAGAFLAVLTPLAAVDLATGATTAGRIAGHVILLLAVGLLVSLRKGPHRAGRDRPAEVTAPGWDEPQQAADDQPTRLRPVSRAA
ncbi:zf-HC2 domain-containing protein [Actinokineospora sp. NPDC004072]